MLENAGSLADVIASAVDKNIRVEKKQSISGGDINISSFLSLSNGRKLFLKENRVDLAPMFRAEAAGLKALSSAGEIGLTPSVPEPLGWGTDGRTSFLLIDFVEQGPPVSGESFGTALAQLHRMGRSDFCGFASDNWIGSTPQVNTPEDSWYDFFSEQRLAFQWRLARKNGFGDITSDREMESLLKHLPENLPEPEDNQPSLLHGDLWGGNWISGADGRPWLIDPAVYYGHREADLAMTTLFGGFPAGFHRAYYQDWPLEPGFSDRTDLYNLYHLLNHLNLFGASYWSSVRNIISRYS